MVSAIRWGRLPQDALAHAPRAQPGRISTAAIIRRHAPRTSFGQDPPVRTILIWRRMGGQSSEGPIGGNRAFASLSPPPIANLYCRRAEPPS